MSYVATRKLFLEYYKNAAGYHPGPVAPFAPDPARLIATFPGLYWVPLSKQMTLLLPLYFIKAL